MFFPAPVLPRTNNMSPLQEEPREHSMFLLAASESHRPSHKAPLLMTEIFRRLVCVTPLLQRKVWCEL